MTLGLVNIYKYMRGSEGLTERSISLSHSTQHHWQNHFGVTSFRSFTPNIQSCKHHRHLHMQTPRAHLPRGASGGGNVCSNHSYTRTHITHIRVRVTEGSTRVCNVCSNHGTWSLIRTHTLNPRPLCPSCLPLSSPQSEWCSSLPMWPHLHLSTYWRTTRQPQENAGPPLHLLAVFSLPAKHPDICITTPRLCHTLDCACNTEKQTQNRRMEMKVSVLFVYGNELSKELRWLNTYEWYKNNTHTNTNTYNRLYIAKPKSEVLRQWFAHIYQR